MYWFILTYLRIVRLPSNADKYIRLREQLLVTSPAGAVAKYYDEHVCLSLSLCVCVCLSVCEDISGITRAILIKFLVHVAYGRGLVLLR